MKHVRKPPDGAGPPGGPPGQNKPPDELPTDPPVEPPQDYARSQPDPARGTDSVTLVRNTAPVTPPTTALLTTSNLLTKPNLLTHGG